MAAKKKNSKPKKTPKKSSNKEKSNTVMAKSDDGTIQVTFTIPYKKVDTLRKESIKELGKDIDVPGFRKGKAPEAELIKHIPQDKIIQTTLSKILPQMFADVINKENLKPAMYPKYELMKAADNEPWEIRATTCEVPEVKLGNYKKAITDASKSNSIWTPEKGDPEKKSEKKELTQQEKEQEILKILLSTTKIEIPRLLIEEESNAKLSQLLERLEKLGLDLDSYLKSVGKTPQGLRKEYEEQSKSAISIDLILSEIANKENIKVNQNQVNAAMEASKADPGVAGSEPTDQQKLVIESILKKRSVLESLTKLL